MRGGDHPQQEQDTTPKPARNGFFRRLGEYRDSIRNKNYRDSLIRRITRQDAPEPVSADSSLVKSERYFQPFAGRVVRDIYYRQVQVFGPRNINDTTFSSSMRLLKLANRLHYTTNEWVIRQSLFFREHDTIDPYTMADNERYLRNRPFIQDARLYIINAAASPDSVDLLVVTKDVFEYGADLSNLTTTSFRGGVSNNNLFGAGQAIDIGVSWRNDWQPPWGTSIRYTKFNVAGSFIDASAGYTTLNDYTPVALDTGVLEGSYYININRPLYRNSAALVGGLFLAENFSINHWSRPDSLYRDYRYQVIDGWIGYNFIRPTKKELDESYKPNVAILLRHYNLFFQRSPHQPKFQADPVYNDRRYYLAQLRAFRQDFFKAHHFFGFGRTEDIPLGYNAAISSGWESWKGRRRLYTALEMQKFWSTRRQGLFNTMLGLSSFWRNRASEDAVIHARVEYYSRLLNNFAGGYLRQFNSIDYLGNPNNFFYKPLSIDVENGIWGYRGTRMTGYQRLNVRSETVYYSPLKVLGFKFNFSSYLQFTQLTENNNSIFKNPLRSAVGLGVRIRNENMSFNTLRVAAFYMPDAPAPVNPLFFEITTVVDFRFDISALRSPQFLQFR
ncbi:BamA/TamA family outer membrane protein [Chitinophaga japonensis]|uniref:Uncharacterized protein n=1 Tax=Chitinophaga japonensis TaxID=104662 RepID=A0A562SYQ0_CHIJA|nr:hypothetical protein [Chitinophaga japonensis]TWI86447.1 hypothetical protein LX66_3704 [Chitinophaga japonensis]